MRVSPETTTISHREMTHKPVWVRCGIALCGSITVGHFLATRP